MADRKRGERMSVQDLLAHLELCASAECSFCRDGCPSYRAFPMESKAPRGKNRVLEVRLRDGGDDTSSLSTIAFECTMCGRCAEVCISGGDTYSIIPGLRELVRSGGAAPKVLIEGATDAVRKGTPYGVKDRSWADGLPAKGRIGYFPGCNFMANEPDVPARTISLLRRLGIEPVPVSDHCCGGPAFNAGMNELFAENAEDFISDLREKGIRTLVMSCPGCLNIIKNQFPSSGIEVVHITEVLANAGIGGGLKMRVAYHDPCNLGRKSGVIDAPRTILKAIGCDILEFADRGRESACCGGGGGFATMHPEGSMASAVARADEAVGMGAEAIVTSCRTCRDRLAEASAGRIPVLLVLDLVDGTAEGGA
jgi:Fe-S oxidoreductase